MEEYPGISYYIHDGSVHLNQHFTSTSDLAAMLNLARSAAFDSMKKARVTHAIYGVKHYDRETGLLCEADIYSPAILLDDAEFEKRCDVQYEEAPGCHILAIHRR